MSSFHIGIPILDIIFVNNEPVCANVGGSALNTAVTLSNKQCRAYFVSSLCKDPVSEFFVAFLHQNHMSLDYINYSARESIVALAFKADSTVYDFRGEIPYATLFNCLVGVEFTKHDVIHYGDFFTLSEKYRIAELMQISHDGRPIKYLDPNVRDSTMNYQALTSTCDILRCSDEDYRKLFGEVTYEAIMHEFNNVKLMMVTYKDYVVGIARKRGRQGMQAEEQQDEEGKGCTGEFIHITVECPKLESVVSTIGAGDNFNAGAIYSILQEHIASDALDELSDEEVSSIIKVGIRFAQEVCQIEESYLSG